MSFEVESIVRIFVALICGGIIGYEREYKNRPAGLRTHMLVCMGAALVMLVSQFMYNRGTGGSIDTTRLGAQVISGIGFLGAGTIIRERFSVKGLTTAASLWAVACIGIAVGAGYLLIAGITTAAIFMSLVVFRKFESIMKIKPEKAKIRITASLCDDIDVRVREVVREGGYSIEGFRFSKSTDKKQVTFSLSVSCPDERAWDKVYEKLYADDDIFKADIEY